MTAEGEEFADSLGHMIRLVSLILPPKLSYLSIYIISFMKLMMLLNKNVKYCNVLISMTFCLA